MREFSFSHPFFLFFDTGCSGESLVYIVKDNIMTASYASQSPFSGSSFEIVTSFEK